MPSPDTESSSTTNIKSSAKGSVTATIHDEDALFTPLNFEGHLPTALAHPYQYEPALVAKKAAQHLQQQLKIPTATTATSGGKMMGVLVCRNSENTLGYLAAYSGQRQNSDDDKGMDEITKWCPPVFDYPTATFFQQGEQELERMTARIQQLQDCPERQQNLQKLQQEIHQAEQNLQQAKQEQKAAKQQRKKRKVEATNASSKAQEEQMRQESAYYQRQVKAGKADLQQLQETKSKFDMDIETLKQQRSQLSNDLTRQIMKGYQLLNVKGETANLHQLFAAVPHAPPGGAGDCAAPKLFQACFRNGYTPVALAEFWWGPSRQLFRHEHYYPCCRGKCQPILQHMLQGLNVEQDPLLSLQANNNEQDFSDLEIVYEDNHLLVVNKPAEVLSVPGRMVQKSVQTEIVKQYPGAMLCHRLDLSTSGLLVIAKSKDVHKHISKQFIERTIKKRYECLLDGTLPEHVPRNGKIDLPLTSDYIHRPMQMVDPKGKPATTYYEILGEEERIGKDETATTKSVTRAYLYPVTGRTHQLRVHVAHPRGGLNLPMVGDDIYGKRCQRLCLHAGFLQLTHPIANNTMKFEVAARF